MDRRPDVGFVRPPEAPVFEPTWEEFRDPMNYIETIRPVGEKYGICKIRPPPSWAPPFAIDGDSFKFTPRIQKLNELEVLFRVKMNYVEQLIRFWKLQGIDLKIPVVERKALDLFSLHKIINEEGGLDIVNQNNKWPKVIQRLGFSGAKGISSILKSHYEKIIMPFDEFVKNSLMPCPDDDECCIIKSCPEAIENLPNSEQLDGEPKPSVKVQTARRMGAKASTNKEKTMLHCFSSGTKITITTSPVKTKTNLSPEKSDSELPESQYSSSADKYFCEVCDGGDDEEHMLLCDGCDDAYHMQCLTPALTDVPPGDWICPKCLAKECMKPLEVYGFEQSEQEYTLESFGSMADRFKSEHFSASPQQVPYPVVEKEFWRLVESPDENVVVEYGADIHAGEHGSGFPTEKTKDRFSGDEDYILSGWNLNNLPVQGSSLLQFVSVNISGMKVPWVYVGMCFASFSWHTEDHWSYSINYLHRGEPKTWYGVPGAKAELLEGCMKNLAPELFVQSPDLLHQLTTLMHPNTLMAHGVPIYRTDQEAGNFVITFPRAYHAGFNQGFNVAEAVNFCPADWIPMGRACVDHYRLLKRQCVFSHDELLCQIAENSGAVDITLARHVYDDLQTALKNEQKFRAKLIEQGVGNLEKKIFELQEDDERQCAICKTTCFLSARKCSCRSDVMICIDHSEKLCKCDPSNHCLVYRYGIDEMEALLEALKARALQLEDWKVRARTALEARMEKRKDVTWFKELILEVTSRNLPKTSELELLKEAVANAEVCTEISRQLLDRKVRSSQKNSAETRNVSRLSVRELENFCTGVDTLVCTFKEALMFQDLLISVNKFKRAADDILRSSSIPSVATLEFQIDWGTRLEVELPELTNLNEMLMMAKWMNDYERSVGSGGRCIVLAELRKLKASGAGLRPHPSFQSSLAKVMNLLAISENLEQRAASCIAPGCRTSIANLENIIKESELLGVALPHIPDIKALLSSAKDWIQKVNGVLSTNDRFLIPDEVESLLKHGEKLPLELDSLDILRKKLCAINIWKDKLNKVFSSHSDRELLQVLVREIDADESSPLVTGPETSAGSVKAGNSVVVKLAKLRAQMLDALRREVSSSFSRLLEQVDDCGACANNNKDDLDHIQQCITCAGKYFGCRNKTTLMHGSSQRPYICPTCRQEPRITIEDIQKLVSSYQQLGFLLSEGRAVVYISAEVLRWQNMARLTLSTDEMTSALKLLNYPLHSSRIWGKEYGGDKTRSDQRFTTDKFNKSSNETANYDWSEMEAAYPIDLSLSSSRKEVLRSPTVDDLVQRLTGEGLTQQLMSMDLSTEAQASLKDLLLESQVLNIATEEAQVIAFLLFAAWQRAQIVETRRREEELRRKREEEERRKREEEEQRRREEELERRREEELRRKREEEERQRKEEELRRKREEEMRRLHEAELRKKEEEDLRRKREAEELRRKKEEHELQQKREEELRKKLEEEELQKKKREELKRKKAEEEMLAKASENKRKREELKKMVESNVNKKKNLGDSKKEAPASQNKKGSVQRKRFQELQRYDEDECKKFGNKDCLYGNDVKKSSAVDDAEWLKNELVDKISEKQENKKKNSKNEENHEVETKSQKKANKRKSTAVEECGSEQKKSGGKKAKGSLSVQKKPKCNQKKKKGRKKGSSDDDSDEDDDDDDYSGSDGYGACASSNCLNPPGRNLDWVQCDSCDKWYHLMCQGLKPHQVSGSQPYFCPLCPSRSNKTDPEVSRQNKSVDLDSSFSSPKSKTVSAKKSSVKEKNCEVQKFQSITPAKATQKTDIAVQSQNRPNKKTAKNKRQNLSASVQENRSATAQESTLDEAQNRKDSVASAPVDESRKKKTKATEKPAAAQKSLLSESPPKTPKSPLKSPGLLSSWSQKFTHPAVLDDSDSRQDEGSKSTQKSCFSQYLYMPWLSDNSAFR